MMRTGVIALALCAGCEPDQDLTAFRPEIVVAPAQLDFGDVGVPLDATETLYIANAGRAPLEVSLSLEDATDTVWSLPTSATLEPDETWSVPITFAPATFLEYSTVLTVSSNDEETPLVLVPLSGTGIDAPLPDISVDPLAIDFDTVTAGDTDSRYLSLANVGTAPLVIESLEQTGSGAFVVRWDPTGETLAPGNERPVVLEYTPTTDSGDSGSIILRSNDPDEPAVEVLLIGNGGSNDPYPVALIDCPGQVAPPVWVTLDGSDSYDPSGTDLTYRWELTETPDTSQASLQSTNQDTTEFLADVAGPYEVQLQVTNAMGLVSSPAKCPIEGIPDDEIHIELSWDGPRADLDLHLLDGRDAQLFEKPGDCTWCNPNPSWGSGGSGDDPRLDLDDRGGYGPENINIRTPASGRYEVAVHYFEEHGDGPVTATVKVFLGREIEPVSIVSRSLERNDVWRVGLVNWPEATFGRYDTEPESAITRSCF